MRDLPVPQTAAEWDELASKIIRANLQIAGLNYVQLGEALAAMGIRQDNKGISGKLRAGRFSAAFFLQALVAIGVVELPLPVPKGPAV